MRASAGGEIQDDLREVVQGYPRGLKYCEAFQGGQDQSVSCETGCAATFRSMNALNSTCRCPKRTSTESSFLKMLGVQTAQKWAILSLA